MPDAYRHGTPILVRADGAGGSKAWLAHLRSLRTDRGLDVSFSVGFTMTEQVQQAILALPELVWAPAVEAASAAANSPGWADSRPGMSAGECPLASAYTAAQAPTSTPARRVADTGRAHVAAALRRPSARTRCVPAATNIASGTT
jgi:hypothetical protein